MRKSYAMVGVGLALVLFIALLGLVSTPSTYAAPNAAPTPVSNLDRGGLPSREVTLFDSEVLTADAASAVINVMDFDAIDLQWIVLQNAITNTVTVKMQYSIDGVTWADGTSFVSSAITHTSDLQQYALFGKSMRVYADVTNANPIMVTVVGVTK